MTLARPPQTLTIAVAILGCLALAVSGAPGARAACPPGDYFSVPVSFAVNGKPNRVLLADFNNDGVLDAACTPIDAPGGGYNNQVAILLGDSSGGFSAPTYLPVGSRPAGLCAAYLDADDKLDLAVTNWNSNTVSVLRGVGDGSFLPATSFPCGVRPYELVATDLDGDDVRDLVVASNGQYSIQVLLGAGDGSYRPPVSYSLPNYGLGVAVGRLNADSFVDVVATADASGCVVFLGIGDGKLGAGTVVGTGPLAYTLALGDLDADDKLDLVVCNSSFAGAAILKGNGSGGFGAPTFYAAGHNCGGAAIEDFDHDGITDFAMTSVTDHSVKIFRGGSSGGAPTGLFSLLESIPAGTFPVGIATGKCDADAFPDLVVAGYNSGNLLALMSTCPDGPPPPERPHLVSVRDVRGDQGGRVFLRWTRSSLDVAGTAAITAYRVWRQLPPEMAALVAESLAGGTATTPAGAPVLARASLPSGTTIDYWEWIGEIPAQQLEGYGYAAPTLQDSTAGANPLTAFFVTALTANPAVFYESNIASGYSVDNLAPQPPATFEGTLSASGVILHWSPSADPDVTAYRLYRGPTEDFVPGPANLLASLPDTGFADAGSLGGCYKLSAVDVHGNEGGFSTRSLTDVTGVEDGAGPSCWLAPPGPNPARLGARLRFSLSRAGSARLVLHDIQGRLVRELSRGPHAGGPHVVEWDGRDRGGRLVRNGLYLLTLEAEGRVFHTRLVVAR